jgi:hypothetical protein
MLRTLLISAATLAVSAAAAQAQFLLMASDNDHKLVVNEWAETGSFERRAVSALEAPAVALPGPSAGAVGHLTPGAPLGGDALDHKVVAGERPGSF